jgi:hypothetical protein
MVNDSQQIDLELGRILGQYRESFSEKTYADENNDPDVLMDLFCITPELKRENRQYWGRELGMCWQLLIDKLCKLRCKDYKPAMKIEADAPTDLFIGEDAIDTKYRIGSGDSGTLKKFKKYGALLAGQGYRPTLLILRSDNLPAAITACRAGGWAIYVGDECFTYIKDRTGFEMKEYLVSLRGSHAIERA